MTNEREATTPSNRPQASVWRLAGRQVWRDLVAGELKLLLWAVVSAGLVWRLMRGLRRADASPPNC